MQLKLFGYVITINKRDDQWYEVISGYGHGIIGYTQDVDYVHSVEPKATFRKISNSEYLRAHKND